MKKSILCLGLAVVLVAVMLSGCGGDEKVEPSQTSATQQPTTLAETTTEDPLTPTPSLGSIATKYCDLLYPKRWSGMLRSATVEENGIFKVEMYANIGEHKELHIYDIVFGGEEGIYIGRVTDNGQSIDINLVSYPFEPDDTWSQEEIQNVRYMKEDINFLIDGLNK